MNTAEIKLDLHKKIDNAAKKQLEEMYGLIVNYLNGQKSIEEWDTLSDDQKDAINEGLEQAEAGLDEPVSEVTKRLRNKYGLNG